MPTMRMYSGELFDLTIACGVCASDVFMVASGRKLSVSPRQRRVESVRPRVGLERANERGELHSGPSLARTIHKVRRERHEPLGPGVLQRHL